MQLNNKAVVKKAKYVFYAAIAILAYRFFSSALMSQIASPPPPLVFPSIDNTYWLLLLLGIPGFITKNYLITTLFDISLLSIPFFIFVYPTQRMWYVLFTCFLTMYALLFNLYSGHHYHSLYGLILISIPFWTSKHERFQMLWKSVRYYTLFIFTSAALWKIARGTAFDAQHFYNILLHQHAQLFYDQPNSWRVSFVREVLKTSGLSFTIMHAVVAIQLSFLIGFVTVGFDRILLVLLILFVVFNYLFMHIVSAELLVLGLTLLPEKFWEKE